MDDGCEDKMSNHALHTRLLRVEMATIYKVGFWALLVKTIAGWLGLFRFIF